MADNTLLSAATGTGDLMRTIQKSTYKTPVTLIDISGATTGVEQLLGDSTHAMPVSIKNISGTTPLSVSGSTVSVSGSTVSVSGSTLNAGIVGLNAGGAIPYSFIGTTVLQTTTIAVTSGQVYGLSAYNWSFTKAFLKIYDTSAAPTTSDTAIHRVLIPASTVNGGAGVVSQSFPGMRFLNGIGYRLSGGILDGDTAIPWSTASEACINVLYKT